MLDEEIEAPICAHTGFFCRSREEEIKRRKTSWFSQSISFVVIIIHISFRSSSFSLFGASGVSFDPISVFGVDDMMTLARISPYRAMLS
jgi:hypothetical protein